MDNIEELITAIQAQNFAAAEPIFNDIMSAKINDVLDAEQIKIASSMFNNGEEDLPEEDIEIVDDVEEDEEE